MIRISQLVAVAAITLIGAGGGLLLTRTIGGRAATDVCRGVGTLEGTTVAAVTPSSANSFATTDTFYTCHKLGFRVIFNARTGEVVSQTPLDQEVVEYYKTHPAENPLTIANKTAAAETSLRSFVTVAVPSPAPASTCPDGAVRATYRQVAASVCLPTGWALVADNDAGVQFRAADGLAELGVTPVSLAPDESTSCAAPQQVTLPSGAALVCAFRVNALGGQGIGITLPGGRRLGINLYRGVSEAERKLTFEVAFSVLDAP